MTDTILREDCELARKENTVSGQSRPRAGGLRVGSPRGLARLVRHAGSGSGSGWRILSTDFPNNYLTATLRLKGTSVDRSCEVDLVQRHKDHRDII